jgi:hypothetical protein
MKRISYYLSDLIQIFRDRIFVFLFLSNLVLLGLIWFFWLNKISPSGYQIYTQFYLVRSQNTTSLLPPVLVSIIVSVNFILSIISRRREALASYLLIGSSLFVLALTLVLVKHYLNLI